MSSKSGGRKRSQEGNRTIADNRKAIFLYEIEDFFDAGIVLTGSEIKSVRQNKINIKESYVSPEFGEIFLINSNIPKYQNSIVQNYNPKRKRKLLLNKKEINKLFAATKKKGMTKDHHLNQLMMKEDFYTLFQILVLELDGKIWFLLVLKIF